MTFSETTCFYSLPHIYWNSNDIITFHRGFATTVYTKYKNWKTDYNEKGSFDIFLLLNISQINEKGCPLFVVC